LSDRDLFETPTPKQLRVREALIEAASLERRAEVAAALGRDDVAQRLLNSAVETRASIA
jgi:hypothetical protein